METYILNYYSYKMYKLEEDDSSLFDECCSKCIFFNKEEDSCELDISEYSIFNVNENNWSVFDISRLDENVRGVKIYGDLCRRVYFTKCRYTPLSSSLVRRIRRSFHVSDRNMLTTREICDRLCNEDACIFYKDDLSCIDSNGEYICTLRLLTRGEDLHKGDNYW